MVEQFTERARRAMVLAADEARSRRHEAIGPEHLLVGILREGACLDLEVLVKGGIEEADAVVVATDGDNTNIVISQVAQRRFGVPCVVIDGVTKTAANIDASWVEFDAGRALESALKRPVVVLNDADAAGLAEMRFGAGVGEGQEPGAGDTRLVTRQARLARGFRFRAIGRGGQDDRAAAIALVGFIGRRRRPGVELQP